MTTFQRRLCWIVAAAAVLRVVYVLAVTRYDDHLYDALYYQLQAQSIADGHGFFHDPFPLMRGSRRVLEAADHPPLTVFVLLPAAFLLGGSELAMRLTMVAFGVGTVVLVALLAREVAGDAVGLVAGAIAAVDPNLWVNDGLLMSEPPGTFIAAALLLVLHRLLRRGPSLNRLVVAGLLTGLGILTRAEFVLFVPLLVVPLLWVSTGRRWRESLAAVAVAGLAALVIVGPWVAFNMARFEKPTFVSTNDGLSLRAANCPVTYHGEYIGWVAVFPPCAAYEPDTEQSVVSAKNRTMALKYMRDEAGHIPVVAAARLGRSWALFRPGQSIRLAAGEGRPQVVSWLAAVTSWLWVPLAAVGAVGIRRGRGRVWPLVAVILLVNAVLALWAGGLLRYRSSAEPAMVVLAAAGVVALARRRSLLQCAP